MKGGGDMQAAWSWTERLSGAIPPLITPLDDAGHVDAAGVEALVHYTLGGGCSGLFVAGGCGLGPWLTAAQRGEVVHLAARFAAGKSPVLAGIMLPASGPACEAARQAEAEGADAVVVASPYYFAVDADDQRRHVEAVLQAVNLPVLIYNIPQCTVHSWLPRTVAALAEEPRVLGIKDSSGNLAGFQGFVAIKQARPDFRVLQGDERVMAACLLMGGDGVIAGLANVAPRLFVDLVAAGRCGDAAACRHLQERIIALHALFSHGPALPALYAACAELGMGTGRTATPWIGPDVGQRGAIAAVLRQQGLSPAAVG
ncbi:MAG TPA: dihydrodipicolinate synthase family protein [Chloroflexota bacterium]|nr:dihydrodipicolinate synthase family protein [Chloroflexota bacterium]